MEESLKFHIKVRVFHKERAFGPGVAELMHLVEETGSLSEACRRMEMAYSKGWKITKRAEEDLGFPLMEELGFLMIKQKKYKTNMNVFISVEE